MVVSQSQQDSSNKGGAGTCPTGQRRSSTAFPHTDLQTVAGVHLQEMHVGFGREQMVNLQGRPPCVEGNRVEVLHRHHDVGISHPNRCHLQRSIRKIGRSPRQPVHQRESCGNA